MVTKELVIETTVELASDPRQTLFSMNWLKGLHHLLIREGSKWSLRRQLTSAERNGITEIGKRRRTLLSPAGDSQQELLAVIAQLRAAAPGGINSKAEAKLLVQAYIDALSPLPLWAIREAYQEWLGGTWGNPSFAPKPSELAERTRRHLNFVESDLRELRILLQADSYTDYTPSEDEHARVCAGFEELKKALQSS